MPGAPLTDPGGRYSRTGLFKSTRSRMSHPDCPRPPKIQQPLAETQFLLARHSHLILLHNARSRHLEMDQHPIECWPGYALALTAPVEPLVQRPAGRPVEKLHAAVIADQPIIVPCPLKLGLERFKRPAQLLVTVRFDPVGHPLYPGPPFLGGRASFHPRLTLDATPACGSHFSRNTLLDGRSIRTYLRSAGSPSAKQSSVLGSWLDFSIHHFRSELRKPGFQT